MELKDVILSTLAEMEDNETTKKVLNSSIEVKKVQNKDEQKRHTLSPSTMVTEKKEIQDFSQKISEEKNDEDLASMESEESFLNSLKERMLVLFEGFQAPNNTNIDAKVDMTLNFLEYVLANIDLRKQEIKKGKQK